MFRRPHRACFAAPVLCSTPTGHTRARQQQHGTLRIINCQGDKGIKKAEKGQPAHPATCSATAIPIDRRTARHHQPLRPGPSFAQNGPAPFFCCFRYQHPLGRAWLPPFSHKPPTLETLINSRHDACGHNQVWSSRTLALGPWPLSTHSAAPCVRLQLRYPPLHAAPNPNCH